MARKRKKKKTKRIPRPRDPFWRARRVLGERKVASAKAYRRNQKRADIRTQQEESE
jgi:hypothetical protein